MVKKRESEMVRVFLFELILGTFFLKIFFRNAQFHFPGRVFLGFLATLGMTGRLRGGEGFGSFAAKPFLIKPPFDASFRLKGGISPFLDIPTNRRISSDSPNSSV